jgi:hypothetical protein
MSASILIRKQESRISIIMEFARMRWKISCERRVKTVQVARVREWPSVRLVPEDSYGSSTFRIQSRIVSL